MRYGPQAICLLDLRGRDFHGVRLRFCVSLRVMEQTLPPQTERGGGFEPARVRQFTVFLDNRVGRLQMLLNALESAAHPIRALSIEESGEAALVRLISADTEAARQ